MSSEVKFAQGCRECRKYYEIFKIDLNKYYDEDGNSIIKTQELYEKFSFTCRKCDLGNILDFTQLCNKETVLFLRKSSKDKNYPDYT